MDDWESLSTSTKHVSNIGLASEGGRNFSYGRGFKTVQSVVNNGLSSSNAGNWAFDFTLLLCLVCAF